MSDIIIKTSFWLTLFSYEKKEEQIGLSDHHTECVSTTTTTTTPPPHSPPCNQLKPF
jgi:hypothetical protein